MAGVVRSDEEGKARYYENQQGERLASMAFEYAERQRFLEILCEEWTNGNRAISSEEIYVQLLNEGIVPGTGDIDAFLTLLDSNGQISGPGFLAREGIEQHGARVITYVDEDTCSELGFSSD